MGTSDINRSIVIFFVMLSDTASFKEYVNSIEHNVKSFSDRLKTPQVPAVKEIRDSSEVGSLQSWFALKNLSSWQVRSRRSVSLELRNFSWSSEFLWVSTHINCRMWELLFHEFCENILFCQYAQRWATLLFLPDQSQTERQISYALIFLTVFETQLYFGATGFMSRQFERNISNIFSNALDSTLAGMAVQILQQVWNALTKSCFVGLLQVVMQPYL